MLDNIDNQILPWTDCDEAEDYVVPNVLSPRDLVFRPDIMDETVKSSSDLTRISFLRKPVVGGSIQIRNKPANSATNAGVEKFRIGNLRVYDNKKDDLTLAFNVCKFKNR